MEYCCFPVGELQANCWLLWDKTKKAVLIDPGDKALRLLNAIEERGLILTAILLTHVHFDHMLAVPAIQQATGVPLLVHEGDADALTDGHRSLTTWVGAECRLSADRLLREGDTVAVGESTLTVLHTPGHTPGSCCFLYDDLLFTGDTLFAGSVGRTDFPGGDFRVQQETLRRLATLPHDLRVLPGHDGETTIGREKATNLYMMRV